MIASLVDPAPVDPAVARSLAGAAPLPFWLDQPGAPQALPALTRASIARADRNEGRRDVWLRLLDRIGLGFDSAGGNNGRGSLVQSCLRACDTGHDQLSETI